MASAFHEPMSRAPVDLDRLNAAERQVLRLLAEGHTAKSIANAIASTPAAVNERLREARRKTGVGSSRELARLLRAQENRDEQMGVGKGASPATRIPHSDVDPWRPQTGVIAMISFFMVAAASAAALLGLQSPASNEVDPMIGTPFIKSPDPGDLHAKVRYEPRENLWAQRMEAGIRARLLQIPLIGKDGNVVRVTCATDLCEIAGTIIQPVPAPKEYDPKLPQSRAMSALQDKAFWDDLGKMGLHMETNLFTGGKGKPDRIVFLLYYSREQPKQN